MHNFRKLKIWEASMELAKVIHKVSFLFPAEEKFGLTSQVNRASVSGASNIAESAGRNSDKEFNQFLGVSLGSTFKLETKILLAHAFGYINDIMVAEVVNQIQTFQKMINGFKGNLIK